MANSSRISVNAFERVMKDTYTPETSFEWNGIEVTIQKTLSLKDAMSFVQNVVSMCFAEDTNEYLPDVKEFAIKVAVLDHYTNFTMPSNIEKKYALVYCTDAVEQVLVHINQMQYADLLLAINKKLEYCAKANIEAVHKQMDELYRQMDSLQENLSNMFAGISGDDIKNISSALLNGSFSEEKLVEEYLKQKKNSGD